MSAYLKKKVVGVTETIRITPKKNAIFLVLKWIWGILGCWLLLIPLIRAIAETIRFCHTEYLITDKNVTIKDKRVLSGSENHPFYVGKGIMI